MRCEAHIIENLPYNSTGSSSEELTNPDDRTGIVWSLKRSDSKGCLSAIAVTAKQGCFSTEKSSISNLTSHYLKSPSSVTIVIKRVAGSSPALGATPSVKMILYSFEYRVVKRCLHLYSRPLRRPNLETWCSGSTKDFGSFS